MLLQSLLTAALGIVHDCLVLFVDLIAAMSRLVHRRAPAAYGITN
jgi:hypothetical protein